MKLGFIIPILESVDVEKKFSIIEEVCSKNKINFDIIFAMNGNANQTFTNIRKSFVEKENVRAVKLDMNVDEHRLITVAMKYCEDYDATIIYSGKEEVDEDIINGFITSWKAGNKIVYFKKRYSKFKKFCFWIKDTFYNLGIKLLNVFKDLGGENDIQLLDQEVVATINQLPSKNRQLRVLDSFVGYQTDIIYSDHFNLKQNKIYDDKTKNYWINFIITSALGCLTLVFFIIALFGSLLQNISVTGLIIVWVLFLCLGVLTYVFSVKTMLIHRVGEQFDNHEIKALVERAEKYNLKK